MNEDFEDKIDLVERDSDTKPDDAGKTGTEILGISPVHNNADGTLKKRRRRHRRRMRRRRANRRNKHEKVWALTAPIKVQQPSWNPFGKTDFFSVHEFITENEEPGAIQSKHKRKHAQQNHTTPKVVVEDQWVYVSPPSKELWSVYPYYTTITDGDEEALHKSIVANQKRLSRALEKKGHWHIPPPEVKPRFANDFPCMSEVDMPKVKRKKRHKRHRHKKSKSLPNLHQKKSKTRLMNREAWKQPQNPIKGLHFGAFSLYPYKGEEGAPSKKTGVSFPKVKPLPWFPAPAPKFGEEGQWGPHRAHNHVRKRQT